MNIKDFLKLKRIKEREIQELLMAARFKRAVQKWKLRIETTKRIRNNFKVMRANKAFRVKRRVVEALRVRHEIRYDVVNTISNLEKMMRDKAYIESFRILRSFATSKALVSGKSKNKATVDVGSILTQLHEKRLRKYFGRFRKKAKEKSVRQTHVMKILKKIDNVNLRDGFRKWSVFTDKVLFAEELNQTGPITEQVFEANRTIHNLKSFMRKENYTEEEIAKTFQGAKEQNLH